ncbi:hypothetical protein [Carboxylicivirga sp. M1479]|uniref:hypothetical protein n=1 Tax=Carboxylicivirga sp. M1479 TaxID=2594476 RepID=UPI00117888BE|nr:hypothetical protein [Carboxylicivirga sp. M1479]TRX70449.1 hypothetical protein FNN09_10745 [Carboxylicivirga sp. M1479]
MDALSKIISTFSKSEASEFSAFINRIKQKNKRKDLELFTLLYKNSDLGSEAIIKRLYPDNNKVAYHALRKKLLKHLSDFIYFKQLHHDDTAETQVSAYVALARYFKEYDMILLSWRYLKKAEQLAVYNEQYAMANQITRLQLDMPLLELKQDMDAILTVKKKYLELAIEDDKVDTAYKIIKQHLQKAKTNIGGASLQQLIETILETYELTHTVSKRPSVIYRLMSIARSEAKSVKDYYRFEPLLIQFYNSMQIESDANERDKVYVAHLQYMLAHTLFRNKKFSQALEYAQRLREQIRIISKTEQARFLPRLTQLYCAIRFFTGHINEAIRMVDATFMQKLRLKPEEVLNLKLNKAIYHFYNEDYKVALSELLSIEHSNKWCAKIAGIEWVLKKDLLDVFIQFELHKLDIASNKIRALLRQREVFEQSPQLQRVKIFLHLVNQIVDDPSIASTKQFDDQVEKAFNWIPIEQEDLHASVFYAWMKAKIVKDDAYSVLLNLISIEDKIL